MQPIIVVGDRTSHGGVVIDGTPESDINGKPIARVGDHATCPIKGHGKITMIASGDPTLIIDGAPVARHGDKTACGATLLSSQVTTFVDSGSSGATGQQSLAAAAPPIGIPYSASESPQALADADQHFLLLDEATNTPLKNLFYRIHANGVATEGRTNDEGKTQLISGARGDSVKIEVFSEGAGA